MFHGLFEILEGMTQATDGSDNMLEVIIFFDNTHAHWCSDTYVLFEQLMRLMTLPTLL
jgi:hypothetical protein